MRHKRNKAGSRDRGEDWLYGRQSVREALRSGRRALFALHARAQHGDETLESLAADAEIPVAHEEARWFERTLGTVHHQGVALRAGPYPYRDFKDLISEMQSREQPGFWLLLDHIQDPQNLGSILRTAEAAGVHGVVLPKDRAAAVTPAVVRASAGASEHVAICRVSNIVQAMETLKKSGVWITGLHADAEAKLYTEIDFRDACGVVLGSEGRGLSRLVRERCDWLAHLPMLGLVDSLNAGAAGAIVMYEVARQRLRV